MLKQLAPREEYSYFLYRSFPYTHIFVTVYTFKICRFYPWHLLIPKRILIPIGISKCQGFRIRKYWNLFSAALLMNQSICASAVSPLHCIFSLHMSNILVFHKYYVYWCITEVSAIFYSMPCVRVISDHWTTWIPCIWVYF